MNRIRIQFRVVFLSQSEKMSVMSDTRYVLAYQRSTFNVQRSTSRPRAGGPQTRATRHTLTMHVTKFILVMLLASPALAAETTSADAALQKARREHASARALACGARGMSWRPRLRRDEDFLDFGVRSEMA